jgi:outer membrane protein assembly factor BamA
MNARVYIILMVVFVLFGTACNNLKKLPAGEKLYTGASVDIRDTIRNEKTIKTELKALLRPKPNSKFLGMRIRLSLYNLAKPPKGKGLNYLLRNKWGEAPVLFSKARPDYTSRILRNYMTNNGFFKATTEFEIKEEQKTASIKYIIHAGHRYVIDSVSFPSDTSAINRLIAESSKRTLLKRGDFFSLEIIKQERERIDLALKEKGYFYFSPDYLIVDVDSTNKGKVNLFVQVKDNAPRAAQRPFRIKNIYIYPDFRMGRDTLLLWLDQISYPNYKLIDPRKKFKPYVFEKIVTLKQDSIYSRTAHNISLQRLVDLGAFRYIRASFERLRDTAALLNANFYLTPTYKRSIQFQVSGNSKSNNFVGSEVRLNMKNRNLLRGAELLDLTVAGGFETQVGGKTTTASQNAWSLTGDFNLYVPRFIVPFRIIDPKTPFVPRTKFNLGYEFLNRADLYSLESIRGGFGYVWKETEKITHDLTMLGFNSVRPTKITPKFDTILQQDISLRQSFEKVFIIGTNYTFNFNEAVTDQRWVATNVRFNIDLSGNTLGLITGSFKKGAQQKTLLGTPFAQYARFSTDVSNFWRLNSNGLTWANRISLGLGYAYGNSEYMPFIKQFFIGGSNSIRAFRARTLGPGSYQSNQSQFLASEAGDIKMEVNSEIRAKLFSIVNGAIFVDAGNIWLRKENPDKPGSDFKNWTKEIAVGTGVGLRFDASIIVVRFDLAFPLRKPWLPEKERWVINKIEFGDKTWRRENLVLNIAIGYPF